MKVKRDRPLAFFDIESTGTHRKLDRIIDLAIVKIMPDGSRQSKVFRVNPEIPIPKGATAVHGITDEDVKDCPLFKEIANQVTEYLTSCDLAGYNVLRFDIPLLEAEFRRAGVPFSMEERRVVDVQRIFHQKEPRDLTAALSFYCNEMHLDAHGAMADVDATIRVLEGQYDRYSDLPNDVKDLAEFCNPKNPEWVDREGKLIWDNENEAMFNFSQHRGRKLRHVAQLEKSFLEWMLRSDFSNDIQVIIRNALEGTFPIRSPATPETGNKKD